MHIIWPILVIYRLTKKKKKKYFQTIWQKHIFLMICSCTIIYWISLKWFDVYKFILIIYCIDEIRYGCLGMRFPSLCDSGGCRYGWYESELNRNKCESICREMTHNTQVTHFIQTIMCYRIFICRVKCLPFGLFDINVRFFWTHKINTRSQQTISNLNVHKQTNERERKTTKWEIIYFVFATFHSS